MLQRLLNSDTTLRSILPAPATGEVWVTKDVPHLRILDDELWREVKVGTQRCAR